MDRVPDDEGPTERDDLVAARLAELGDYVLEAVTVEPFTTEPGNFIAYHWPWDGLDYDT